MPDSSEISKPDMPRTVEDRVVATLRSRGAFGLNKYGTTMDRKDLSLADWGTHLQQEMLDGAQYAQRVIDGAKLLEEARRLIGEAVLDWQLIAFEEWMIKYDQQFGAP